MRSPLGAILNRTGAATPVPYVSRSQARSLTGRRGGAEAQMNAMGSVGTVFAMVSKLAGGTSQVRWMLYRKNTDGRRQYISGEPVENRREIVRHAALDLWNTPNKHYTGQRFRESFQQHIDLTGQGYWVIGRNPRSPIPLELWPVRPDRLEPVPDPEDFLIGYIYTAPGGEQVPLQVRDVISLQMPNPMDPFHGLGPIQAVLTDIDASRYSAEWNRNFFANSAQPGGIIQVDKRLDDTEFNEMVDRWREQHQGVANAHRVAILENGATWADRKFTMQDMQFAELRSMSREIIREAFGFPVPMLGTTENVNRANADAAEVMFARWCLVPRLERIKEALNTQVLPLFGGGDLEFDYVNPVPADRLADAEELTARANAAAVLVDAGWDAAQVLETIGMPAMDWSKPVSVAPAPMSEPLPAADARLMIGPPRAGRSPRRAIAAAPADGDDDESWAEFLKAVAALESAWESEVLPGQFDALHAQVKAAVEARTPAAFGELHAPGVVSERVLRSAVEQQANRAALLMAMEARRQGVAVDAPTLDAWLRQGVSAFGGELLEIANAVAILIDAGLAASAGMEAVRLYTPDASPQGIADQVVAFLRGLKGVLRKKQLGAALHRATNLGRLATLKAAPPAVYTAREAHDGNECDPCSEIDGHVYRDLAAAEADYGGGPYRHCLGGVNCRGTVDAEWPTKEEQ